MADKKHRSPLGRFFGAIWGAITWLRSTVMNVIFLLFIVMIFSIFSGDGEAPLPEKAALVIAPSGFLVDQRSYADPMSQLLAQNSPDDVETLVRDLTETIDAAINDDRITGIVIDPKHLVGGGISKLDEIGQSLQRFKASGKPIIAVADTFSQDQYYLASYADQIHLHPQGSLYLTGYASYRNYYKSALDKLNVNYHVFKVGTYKDYIEPYTRDSMSAASREHNGQWLNELWNMYSSQIETRRQLEAGSLNDYINNMSTKMAAVAGNSAQLALDSGLVDQLSSRQSSLKILQEKFGLDVDKTHYSAIHFKDYKTHLAQKLPHSGDKVGLIVAAGTILDGEQPAGSIGGDSLAQLFRNARADKSIKAIVLRIDSGGGSAFASEIIRDEIQTSRDAGIPVVVSMGSVAASGGYWISTASDKVFATPATITGSIGVFGAFPTLENTLSNIGVYTDGLGTTELAGSMRLDRPLSPLAGNVIQQGVEHIYARFLTIVAEARNSTPEAIDSIAQGRVWSGSAALDINLVDQLGYLHDAIKTAAELAKLDTYEVEEIIKPPSPSEMFLEQVANAQITQTLVPQNMISGLAPLSLRHALEPLLAPFKTIDSMNDPQGIYLQCSGCAAP